MAETNPPEGIVGPDTGRHGRKRKARKRRAGDSAGALSHGSFDAKISTGVSGILGLVLIIGQIVATRLLMPTEVTRTLVIIVSIMVLSGLVIWLDLLRSKKRNPRPRWMRGVLIAGFLCFSVALGSLVVLTMSANPIEESSFVGSDNAGAYGARSHFELKMLQLKFAIVHILAAVAGLSLLAQVFAAGGHRRSHGS